jgi:hypothetical protein
MPLVTDATLLLIDNQTVPGLKSYRVEYQKMWADQNVNMSGEVRATLQGLKANIILTFGGDLRENDVASLTDKLNQDVFGVTYFDPRSKTTKTAQYISSDVSLQLVDKLKGRYETIDIELLPVARYV